MDCLKYFLLPLLFLSFVALNPVAATGPDKDVPPYNEEEIMARLANMDQDFIETKYEPVVEGYIKGYA